MAGPIRISILANGSQARAELERTGVAAGTMGKGIARLGKIMAGAFAVDAIAHGVGKLVDLSATFESSMTRIQTQAGASAADVKTLSKQVLALGGSVSQSPDQLAESLYHLKSVGLDNVRAMKALKSSAQFAAVGNADLEETTNALAGTWRSGIKGAGSFSHTVATLNAIIGAGNMKMADLNDAIGTGFLPSARSFGLSLKDVGSALAVLTDEGIPANVAATRLRMTFSLLGAPSSKAAAQLATIGLSAKSLAVEMRKPDGLARSIGLLKDHLKGLSQVDQAQLLSHAFGGGRSSSAILTLINNFDVLRQKERQIAGTADLGRFAQSVAKNAETATQKIGRFKSALETLGTEAGGPLAGELASLLTPLTRDLVAAGPKLSALGGTVRNDLGPAFRAVSKTVGDYAHAIGDAGGASSALLGVLKPTGDVIALVAKGLDAIPGPLKSLGIEAGLAALVLPKLTAGFSSVAENVGFNIARLQQFRAELTYTETKSIALSSVATRLGGAFKTAAGIGGMLALTQSTQTANQNLSLLEKAAGGAALGFSVGGPWGAALGGGVGLVAGLSSKMATANASLRTFNGVLTNTAAIRGYTKDTNDLRDSLDQVTGAFNASTNAGIRDKLVKSGQLPTLNKYGVSTRALILAIKGNKDALTAVAPGFDKLHGRIAQVNVSIAQMRGIIAQVQAKGANTAAGDQLLKSLGFGGSFSDLTRQYQALLGVRNGLRAAAGVLPGFTKDLRNNQSAIRAHTRDTRDFVAILKKAGVSAHIAGQINVRGIGQTAGDIAKVIRQFHLAKNASTIEALIKASGWQDTNAHIQAVINKLHALGPAAHAGGSSVGTNMVSGAVGALNSGHGAIAAAGSSFVAAGIAAMRKQASIKSPSRKTHELGVYLGQGLALGLDSTHATLRVAGQNAASQALAGMQTPALDFHRAQLARKAAKQAATASQGRPMFELRLDDGTSLHGYVHRHARDAARDEIDQADAFWTGRG